MASSSPFKNDVLKGKVALVSGGGSGINFGIVRSLGLHGSKVAIMGRRKEVLDKAVAKLQSEGVEAFGIQGDVRNFVDCEKVVAGTIAKFGKIDILVNGAAGNFLCAPEDLSVNGFKTVMEIDAIGTFHMSKAAFESLKATKGVILNISATLHYTTTYYQIHASAAKAAVDSMTRSLAVEWGKYGIRTVGIAPGPIADTEGMDRLSGGAGLEDMAKKIPLRRVGKIEDIAQAALYLTAAGSYVNGHTIVVDGGSWLRSSPFVSEEVYASIAAKRKAKL
eukprot:Phypoly_transcript_14545.p1 GENE.Phypoly_transcript_14545~~Phypoly_transcript_14545.p1  ORF type:complete len:308 (+),score=47.69 Phypoly_transcript_14545:92-925(+)